MYECLSNLFGFNEVLFERKQNSKIKYISRIFSLNPVVYLLAIISSSSP
jgi:hypothetical protein